MSEEKNVPSRFHFSLRGLLAFLVFCVVFAALVVADRATGRTVDHIVIASGAVLILVGVVITSARMWRSRGDCEDLWRAAHGSQIGWLPRKWQDWILGKNDPR